MRRVVVTGIGMCTPLGFGTTHCWNNLISSKSELEGSPDSKLMILNQKLAGNFC